MSGSFFDVVHKIVLVPLKKQNTVFGIFGLSFLEPNRNFSNHDISLLIRFAELASIALYNATLVFSYKNELDERKQAEEALRKSQADNMALINAIPDPMFIINRKGTFISYKASKEQTPWLPDELVGKLVFEVLPADIATKIMQGIEMTIVTGEPQVFEYQLPVNNKLEYYEIRLVVSRENEVLAIIRNITERKTMQMQMEHLSLHDALTGLYNRAFFEEEMKRREIMRDCAVGLIICDVDGLKVINDSLGHNTGDIVLKAVADILQNSFRPGDVVSRIGGDEFAVLLPNNSVQVLEADCRRIREKINHYSVANPTVPISLSIGFAVSKQTPIDMTALFKEADNYMYREKLHRRNSARNAIVQALMKALEARDFITEGHGDRLQDLVEAFAIGIGLPENSIHDLRLLAHFHDIGKVGIPDSILFKTGPLTKEEWVIMRQHCEIGYRIAKSVPDLAPIADWILKHHEWWNGKGYPLGLAGDAIPVECRILTIADAFDAMTSDRPYHKARPKSEAIAELRKCAGSQFDLELVELFIKILDREVVGQ